MLSVEASIFTVTVQPGPDLRIRIVQSNSAQHDQSCMQHVCVHVHLYIQQDSASGCNGILLPPTVSWLAVYTTSRLTLCWLQHWLNAHLTHSLPLWCNPVEVISFTGLSTSASVGGLWGSKSVFNQPATNHSSKQNQL